MLVGGDALALGCVPVVNLFPQRCEPIALTHTETEYRVVPDARRPRRDGGLAGERVRETRPDGSLRPWRPFYRLAAGGQAAAARTGGLPHRRAPSLQPGRHRNVPGPADPDFDPERPADTVLSVDALCINRDLPTALPFGGGHPRLRLVEGDAVGAPASSA